MTSQRFNLTESQHNLLDSQPDEFIIAVTEKFIIIARETDMNDEDLIGDLLAFSTLNPSNQYGTA